MVREPREHLWDSVDQLRWVQPVFAEPIEFYSGSFDPFGVVIVG
jgi:hypothetical protein